MCSRMSSCQHLLLTGNTMATTTSNAEFNAALGASCCTVVSPFQGYTVQQLSDEAKKSTLRFHHAMKKDDLFNLLNSHLIGNIFPFHCSLFDSNNACEPTAAAAAPIQPPSIDYNQYKVVELRVLAKQKGIKNYFNMNKLQLVLALDNSVGNDNFNLGEIFPFSNSLFNKSAPRNGWQRPGLGAYLASLDTVDLNSDKVGTKKSLKRKKSTSSVKIINNVGSKKMKFKLVDYSDTEDEDDATNLAGRPAEAISFVSGVPSIEEECQQLPPPPPPPQPADKLQDLIAEMEIDDDEEIIQQPATQDYGLYTKEETRNAVDGILAEMAGEEEEEQVVIQMEMEVEVEVPEKDTLEQVLENMELGDDSIPEPQRELLEELFPENLLPNLIEEEQPEPRNVLDIFFGSNNDPTPFLEPHRQVVEPEIDSVEMYIDPPVVNTPMVSRADKIKEIFSRPVPLYRPHAPRPGMPKYYPEFPKPCIKITNEVDPLEYLVTQKPTRPQRLDKYHNARAGSGEIIHGDDNPNMIPAEPNEIEMDQFLEDLLNGGGGGGGDTESTSSNTSTISTNDDDSSDDSTDDDSDDDDSDDDDSNDDDSDSGPNDDNPDSDNSSDGDDDSDHGNPDHGIQPVEEEEEAERVYIGGGGGGNVASTSASTSNTNAPTVDAAADDTNSDDDDEDLPPGTVALQYINVTLVDALIRAKFGLTEHSYRITLRKNIEKLPRVDLISRALNEMMEYAKTKSGFISGDFIDLQVTNPALNQPIRTGLQTNDHVESLKEKLEQILTSDETVDLFACKFHVQTIKIPRGEGRTKILNLAKNKHTKTSINQIKNDDKLCGLRAVIVGMTHHTDKILDETLNDSQIKDTRKGKPIQNRLTNKLHNQLVDRYAGDGFTCENGLTIANMKFVEEYLDIQIVVIEAIVNNPRIYSGIEKEMKIYLYKDGNHFDTINSMKGFYGSVYYCELCNSGYQNPDEHPNCTGGKKCKLCNELVHSDVKRVLCTDCNRYCVNKDCMKKHKETVCKEEFKCIGCSNVVQRSDVDHKCGYSECGNCKQHVDTAIHKCFMKDIPAMGGRCAYKCKNCGPSWCTRENKRCTYTEKYIFFDYECQQETGQHVPNLIITRDFNNNIRWFESNEEFCAWLVDKQHKDYTAIAHYARGYDSYFILQYCIKNTIEPEAIFSGSKVMMLKIGPLNLRIIDSHNFIASPLADFPKTFGLTELKKGYFPHLFNTKENENYVGDIPAAHYYCPDRMKAEARKDFLDWHKQKAEEHYQFDMKSELFQYCSSDVDILRRGCLKFREDFLDSGNLDPFCYTTIASDCMALYRSKYLKPNTIAVDNKEFHDQFSKVSISWLNSFDNPNIVHASNGGEKRICGAKVDGFDSTSNTVYQFHGCFWHGCPDCFDEETTNRVNHECMGDLYQKTVERTEQLQRAGYTVVEMWECKWKKTREYSKNRYLINNQVIEPLNPRDAFFGGRTEVFKLKKTVDGVDGKIKYIDVCSLYPTVMYYDPYPIGHPMKILNPPCYDPNWFGFVKCKVLPPRDLYIPVLPCRVQMSKSEKLLFTICVKCAIDNQPRCTHTDAEREFVGTWSTREMNKAIEMGYEVLETYEVWHFDKSTDLWKDYITYFLKVKLESSEHSYPTKEAYVAAVKCDQGIDLDIDKIAYNPGRRAVAKLCLNSLWGKFGQRDNMGNTEYLTDPCRFYKILLDDKLTNVHVFPLSEEMVQVNYKFKDQYVERNYKTNIYVAAFTTANARLRLYDQLSKLNEAVLYCDTDSIIYVDNGTNTVTTGDLLGEWTDELKGGYITKFIASGPKSYYYKTNTGKECLKVKGFTLHYTNAKKITGSVMELMIDKEFPNVITVDKNIVRDVKTKQLVNTEQTKKFGFNFDKRVICDNFDTVPYGYIA